MPVDQCGWLRDDGTVWTCTAVEAYPEHAANVGLGTGCWLRSVIEVAVEKGTMPRSKLEELDAIQAPYIERASDAG